MSGDDLVIERFDGAKRDWDAAIALLDGSSFCHAYGWRTVMEDVLGHETSWWLARDAKRDIVGALPLVRVKSRVFGDYLISMPFLSYGGPAGSLTARRALAETASREATAMGVDLLELRTRLELPGTGLTTNARKLTVVKSLPATTEELWEKGLKAKVRSQVRRPMKEGMETLFGPDHLDAFYMIFARTMRDLGTPVLPSAFFEAIQSQFPESSIFGVVVLDGLPVAAACGFLWQDEFEITWAGASREHARSAPNMLLYWGFMEECVRRGATAFNFGRCTPDSGTHRFKKQWGSVDEALPWLQWSPSGVPSTPNPDSPKFRAATSLWKRLPVPVTNVIGPRVSRLLP